jgi:hypothetical protein
LAGETACEDIYWFDLCEVHQTDIAIIWNTWKVLLKNLGRRGIPFAMPPDNSSGYS